MSEKSTRFCFWWVAGLVLMLGLTSSTASAREYEARLVIENCGDLYEYELSGDLPEDDFELLLALCHRPLNINRADRYMLFDLPGMTYELADRIVEHRSTHGYFKTLEDLLKVEGLEAMHYEEIMLLISVEDDAEVQGVDDIPVMAEIQSGTIGRSGFKISDATNTIASNMEFNRLHQDYLRLKGTGLSYFGFGGLLTNRERNEAYWDKSLGRVVSSEGPVQRLDLDKAYLAINYQSLSLVLGSFDVGFGEKVTFDTTGLTNPHGWRENRHFSTDVNNARIRPDNSLFGAALSVTGVDFAQGWLDMTAFASYEAEDIFQYYYRFQMDEYYEAGEEGDCPYGYSRGESSGCYSTGVGDANDVAGSGYRYVTLRDAYSELLYGGNATWSFSDRTRVGVTGYQSQTEMLIAPETNPVFAWHARMPRKSRFGAVGVNGQVGLGELDLAAEYAHTMAGGNAAYVEGVYEAGSWLELIGGLRWYDRAYNNPYSRSPSAPTVTLGTRQRNERGARLKAVLKPVKGLRSVTTLEGWYLPEWAKFDSDQGKVVWGPLEQYDLRLDQRVDWDITRKETLSVRGAFSDNDLSRGGDKEIYSTPYANVDFTDLEAMQDSMRGHGNKTKVEVGVSSRRLKMLNFSARYRVQWEQSRKKLSADELEAASAAEGEESGEAEAPQDPYRYFRGVEHYATARATLRPMEGTRIVLNGHKFFDQADADMLAMYQSPEYKFSAGVWQRLGSHFSLHVLYGVLHYNKDRVGRYTDYHVGRAELTARF